MTGQIYLDLTNEFNDGELRAILSEGLAVVLHRLALASKDGDWIVREDSRFQISRNRCCAASSTVSMVRAR